MRIFCVLKHYISPYFVIRKAISDDIAEILESYNFNGKVLDFGCGSKPYKKYFNKADYLGIDYERHSINKDFSADAPDFYFNKKYNADFLLQFSDGLFDNVVSFQVLEHHKNPQLMISEINRVMKKGGFFLMTCPFLGGLHEEPNDFQRFTKYGLNELLENNGFEVLFFKKQGSIFSTISMLMNEYLNGIAANGKTWYAFSVAVYPFFWSFQYLALLLDKIFKSKTIFFNQVILSRKS